MYDYLKGKIVSKQQVSYRGSHLVIDVNSVGYLVNAGKRTIEKIQEDCEIKIYVSLIHKEDYMGLTGFITKEERDIFNILQSVSGIGVKLALLILDEFSIEELIDIMIREDFKELSRAKGVGTKVAQKIILELKDKLRLEDAFEQKLVSVQKETGAGGMGEAAREAVEALAALGYPSSDALKAVRMAEITPDMTAEEILRLSLKNFGK